MLSDTHLFLGPWPFLPVRTRTARELSAYLRTHRFGLGLVSPLGALFLPDPMPANRELITAVRGHRALVPVPIINPALANWREQLDECRELVPLRAVRLTPGYHNYTLQNRSVKEFMGALPARRLTLMLTARLEDERNRYFGLMVKGLRLPDISAFLQRHASQHVVCNGLYKREIELLAKDRRNFTADFTFAEFLTTLESLRESIPARRLVVGTAHPLLSLPAQAAKLRCARLPRSEIAAIGSGNIRRLLGV